MLTEEREDVIRQAHAAVERGDWNAVFAHLTPDVVLDDSRARGPQRGIYRGRDELRRVWEGMMDVWESLRIEIGDLTAVGDVVVMPRTLHLRGRQGIELEVQTAWLLTFEADKIARICLFQEEHEAMEAARAQR